MKKSLPVQPSGFDGTLDETIHKENNALAKQAQEVFVEAQKILPTQGAENMLQTASRELLESMTTGKSFATIYDEVTKEAEKQEVLVARIYSLLGDDHLPFAQKQQTISELEQTYGNILYVVAYNTLVEKQIQSQHTLLHKEQYAQMIAIDEHIQMRRDQEIGDLIMMIAQLIEQSKTIKEPLAKQDIITKLSIIMLLGSGNNVRKIYETEYVRLTSEFAQLFFTIRPTKNGAGTKRLLRTMQQSYTSIEMDADLEKKHPALDTFVHMIEDMLLSAKTQKHERMQRDEFMAFHSHIFMSIQQKLIDALDNVPDEVGGEIVYNMENHAKFVQDRNTLNNSPQKVLQLFSLLYNLYASSTSKRNIAENMLGKPLYNLYTSSASKHDSAPLGTDIADKSISESIKYIIDATERRRVCNQAYTLDVSMIDNEVLGFALQHFDCLGQFIPYIPLERLFATLPKEQLLKQIQHSKGILLQGLIEQYGLAALKAQPDGMWLLMTNMSATLGGSDFDSLMIDRAGNAYCNIRRLVDAKQSKNIPYPHHETHYLRLDGSMKSLGTADNPQPMSRDYEYFFASTKDNNVNMTTILYKGNIVRSLVAKPDDFLRLLNVENKYPLFEADRGGTETKEQHHDGKHEFHMIKYLDDTKALFILIQSEEIQAEASHLLIKQKTPQNETIYIDIMNNEKLNISKLGYQDAGDFHDGLARVSKASKESPMGTFLSMTTALFGFIDQTGKEVIPCEYDWVGDFSEGLCAVSKGGHVFFINQQNEKIFDIPYGFSQISSGSETSFVFQHAYAFADGYTRVEYRSAEKEYPSARSSNPAGYYEAGRHTHYTKFLDKAGNHLQIPGATKHASDFSGGIAKAMLQDGSRGLIDTRGRYYDVPRYAKEDLIEL